MDVEELRDVQIAPLEKLEASCLALVRDSTPLTTFSMAELRAVLKG